MLPVAKSLTHEHLLAVVLTERTHQAHGPFRVLDAGCGDGSLICYLHRGLSLRLPNAAVEVHGFDVGNHGVQKAGFLEKAVAELSREIPEVRWSDRVVLASGDGAWPFPDGHFDVVVSNQVGEHVFDLGFFFREVARTLRPGGIAAHLFPLQNYVLEGHLLLPFAHRLTSHDTCVAFIKFASRLGLGKFRTARSSERLESIAEQHADYLHFFTYYRKWNEIVLAAKTSGLRISHRYTKELYLRKLRALLAMERATEYRRSRSPLGDALWFHLLKFVSGVTVVLEKKQTYQADWATARP